MKAVGIGAKDGISVDAQIGDREATGVDKSITVEQGSVTSKESDTSVEKAESVTIENGIGNVSLAVILTAIMGPFLMGWIIPNPKRTWFRRKT